MWKKILMMSLVLVMALSLSACVAESPSAQEIVNGVIESLNDIETYQFDMDMTLDMAGQAEGETIEVTMVIHGSGAEDFDNRQMEMDMAMNIAMLGEVEMEVIMGMYLIGDMIYMMIDIPLMGSMWMKSNVPEGYWEEINQVESQVELLEAGQVEVIGSETVGGVDCYVLQLTPDMEQLWQYVMQQAELTQEEMPNVGEEYLQEVFKSMSVKQWVAKDTYFIIKAEIDMAVELTPEAMGVTGEEGVLAMDIAMDFLAHNYNKPVSIQLPPEAAGAMEIPFLE